MKANDRRLSNLERAAGIGEGHHLTVVLNWFSSPVTGAECAGVTWQRDADEEQEEFGSGSVETHYQEFEVQVQREAPSAKIGNFRIIRLTGEVGGWSEADIL